MTTTNWYLALSNGDGAIDFTSGSYGVIAYEPLHAPVKLTKAPPNGYAGEAVTEVSFQNVAETISLIYQTTAQTAFMLELRAIESLLRQAERRQNDPNISPVHLRFGSSGSASYYQSEVFSGRVAFDPDLLGADWRNDTYQLDVIVEREPTWSVPGSMPLFYAVPGPYTMSGSSPTALATLVALHDVETPVYLSAQNSSSGSYGGLVCVQAADQRNDGSLTQTIVFNRAGAAVAEIGATSEASVVRTVIADASAASGSAAQFVISSAAVEAVQLYEDVVNHPFSAFQGKSCLLVMKTSAALGASDLYAEALLYSGGGVTQRTPKKLLSATDYYHELGYLRLPQRAGLTSFQHVVNIEFTGASNPYTVKIAQIYLIAADSYRRYTSARGVYPNEYLKDNANGAYILSSGSAAFAVQAQGKLNYLPFGVHNYYTVFFWNLDGSGGWDDEISLDLSTVQTIATI